MFNAGVEVGLLMFIIVVMIAFYFSMRIRVRPNANKLRFCRQQKNLMPAYSEMRFFVGRHKR
jgi:hypothetical protein